MAYVPLLMASFHGMEQCIYLLWMNYGWNAYCTHLCTKELWHQPQLICFFLGFTCGSSPLFRSVYPQRITTRPLLFASCFTAIEVFTTVYYSTVNEWVLLLRCTDNNKPEDTPNGGNTDLVQPTTSDCLIFISEFLFWMLLKEHALTMQNPLKTVSWCGFTWNCSSCRHTYCLRVSLMVMSVRY